MQMKNLILFISFIFWTSSVSAAILQPGMLDPGYGVNGLTNPFVGTSSVANDSKGGLDTGFNTTGKVMTKFPNGVLCQRKSLLIQSDGKLLAAGFSADIQNKEFAIALYFDKPTEYPPVSPNSFLGGGSGGYEIISTHPLI